MRFLFSAVLLLLANLVTAQNLELTSLLIPDNLKKNANAVVRTDSMVVKILSQQNMIISSRRVVTVFNKLGNNKLFAHAGYNNSVKIRKIQATIYNAFGKEIKKIREKDFKDVSAVSGGTLYSDSRVKYLKYTPTEYPYTMVLEKEIQTKNTVNLPSWSFIDGFLVSVAHSSFSISYPSQDLKPVFKEMHFGDYNIKKIEGANIVTFLVDNLPAIKNEMLSPSFSDISPWVMARLTNFYYEGYKGKVNNWKDLGSWMYANLLHERAVLKPETEQLIKDKVKGASSDLEKAKIVYKYVQDNTRYISVQVGIGGIQPIEASEVDRVKYGDCKGLSNYTHALLNAVGVTSYYTHVEAGKDPVSFEDDFASLSQGNHVILAIPIEDEYSFIDCTSQVHPFGFIGDFTDNRKVLIIKPEGGELYRTTSYLEKVNKQETKAIIVIKEDASVEAEVEIATYGIQYDNRFNIQDLDKDKLIEHYQDYWSYINNISVASYELNNNKNEVEFKEAVNVSATNYSSISGDRLLFMPNALNRNKFVPKRYRSRKLSFQIKRGFYDEDHFTINIPENYNVESMPETQVLETEFGSYAISVEKIEKNKLLYTRSFLLKKGLYNAEKYNEYRNFRKKIAKLDNSKIALLKTKV